MVTYTVPGMKSDSAERVIKLLHDRLNSLTDLALTLRHVHWHVTAPDFISPQPILSPGLVGCERFRPAREAGSWMRSPIYQAFCPC